MEKGVGRRGRVRKTAEERREEILEAAVPEFAARGLHGASVEDLAARAGVSQPYVYRLFGTKKDLFLAATGRVRDRIMARFREAAEREPADALEAMGRSYNPSLFRREEMMLLLQGYAAAADDEEVRETVGERFAELWRFVQYVTGANEEETWRFFASGMLLTVDAAIDLMGRLGEEGWPEKFMRAEE